MVGGGKIKDKDQLSLAEAKVEAELGKLFRCEFCEFDFKKESEFNYHKENLCKRFKCELCG